MTYTNSILREIRISFVGCSFEKFKNERKEKKTDLSQKGKCYFQEYAKGKRNKSNIRSGEDLNKVGMEGAMLI